MNDIDDEDLPPGIIRASGTGDRASGIGHQGPGTRDRGKRKGQISDSDTYSPEPRPRNPMPDAQSLMPGSRITAIEAQERHKDRVSIYLDGRFTLGIFADVAVTLGLKIGQVVTPERLEEIALAETRRKVREDAVRLLSFRPRAEKELTDRLRQKGYDDALIADTMTRLREYGYVNDETFAATWIEARGKTRGRQALAHELSQKGVARETTREILNERSADTERAAARAAALKRVGERPADTSRPAQARLAAYLARRGFTWDTVRPILSELYAGGVVEEEMEEVEE